MSTDTVEFRQESTGAGSLFFGLKVGEPNAEVIRSIQSETLLQHRLEN